MSQLMMVNFCFILGLNIRLALCILFVLNMLLDMWSMGEVGP